MKLDTDLGVSLEYSKTKSVFAKLVATPRATQGVPRNTLT